MIIIKKSYHKEKAYNDTTAYNDKPTAYNDGTTAYNNKPTAYNDGTTAYNDKPTAYNDGTTAYNNKLTAYNDGTTAYNDKPTAYNKFYHIRQLWRSILPSLKALSSCVCKTMERVINKRLVWLLEKNNYDQLIRLETFIRDTFVNKEYAI